nr:MAG TPA: hypothetical protein [Caudoviricetes sp.]
MCSVIIAITNNIVKMKNVLLHNKNPVRRINLDKF